LDIFAQIVIAATAAAVILGTIWAIYGALRTPVRCGRGCGVCMVVTAKGGAEGLEQTLKGLVWLEQNGIVVARILIVDCGMDDEGLTLVRLLAQKHANIVLTKPEEVMQWIVETSSSEKTRSPAV